MLSGRQREELLNSVMGRRAAVFGPKVSMLSSMRYCVESENRMSCS